MMAKKIEVDVLEKKIDEAVEEEKVKEDLKDEKDHVSILDLSRKVLLAGIGAAALAEEEIKHFVDKLVDRGEIAEKDARKLLKEVIDRREKMVQDKVDEVKRKVPVTVATKSDIEDLNARIAELTKRVEELKVKGE
jgi:polyhydroxyalkanoate synthesis regulator phasin